MKKGISKYVKIILLCLCIVYILIGCNNSFSTSNKFKLKTQKDITNYIIKNFSQYKDRIEDELKIDSEIVSDKENEQEYIEFHINPNTKLQFKYDNIGISVIKNLSKPDDEKGKKKIEIYLEGIKDDAKVHVSLETQYGYIVSEYKANDLEHPILNEKEKEENYNSKIKTNISTEEIKDLI